MKIETVKPMQVLCFETKTSLKEISQYVRIVVRRLYETAFQNQFEITGPVYWIYEGADGKPDTIFTLTIALPISPASHFDHPEFKIKSIDTFHCITGQLYGEWSNLGSKYQELIGEVMSQKLVMSGQNREIYIHMDFENPDRNITEVQIGIIK